MAPVIRRSLPPLNALRAFESAARHESFTQAANELCITQAAISHQIKVLEEWLQLPLFIRSPRQLVLTKEGRAYARDLTTALNLMAESTRSAVRDARQAQLTVSVFGSVAALWLWPRIAAFQDECPDIQVRVIAMDHFADFLTDDVDVEIRYGDGDWPDLHVAKVRGEEIYPVCSPTLLENGAPMETLADLKHHKLIHDIMALDWREWLEQAGPVDHGIDTEAGMTFNRSHLVVNAAIAGQGVALGRGALVEDALADGRLVRPFAEKARSPFAYYVVAPKSLKSHPKVERFALWLLEHCGVPDEA